MERAAQASGFTAGAVETLYNWLWRPAKPLALMAAGAQTPLGRRQRLGLNQPPALDAGAVRVWLHAASVGEIEAIRPIALGLRQQLPHVALFVTAMTPAGCEAAARRIPGAQACWLAPLDHPGAVAAFLRAVQPALVLIAETELWPNYFIQSRRLGARLAIVNARISQRSLKRYRLMRPLLQTALRGVDIILAQSEQDARRFAILGADPARITVSGNTKFGLESAPPLDEALARFATRAPLLVAGSTAPGEEELLLAVYLKLREVLPHLTLALAPRHLQRIGDVRKLIEEHGLRYVTTSEIKEHDGDGAAPVLLVDTLGDLRGLYHGCALAFVGGSLFKGRGGQNLGEAAAAEVPVLFGPYHENQLPMARALLESGGGTVTGSAEELLAAARVLLTDQSLRRERGRRARLAYERLSGAAAVALPAVIALLQPDHERHGVVAQVPQA